MTEHPITIEDGHILQCPNCGNSFLHQQNVAVFNRDEDAEFGKGVFVSQDGEVRQSSKLHGNPSPRRSGMAVSFSCETCPANLELLIYQHKGLTVVKWLCQ